MTWSEVVERERQRAIRAEAEVKSLTDALRALLDDMGVVLDDPRLRYVEVQISRVALDKAREALRVSLSEDTDGGGDA